MHRPSAACAGRAPYRTRPGDDVAHARVSCGQGGDRLNSSGRARVERSEPMVMGCRRGKRLSCTGRAALVEIVDHTGRSVGTHGAVSAATNMRRPAPLGYRSRLAVVLLIAVMRYRLCTRRGYVGASQRDEPNQVDGHQKPRRTCRSNDVDVPAKVFINQASTAE